MTTSCLISNITKLTPLPSIGIIRSIDVKTRQFHIITPVPKEELMSVNTILKGNIGLPFSAFYQVAIAQIAIISNSLIDSNPHA